MTLHGVLDATHDPQPLPYLDGAHNRAAGAFEVVLEVWLQTSAMAQAGRAAHLLSTSKLKAYVQRPGTRRAGWGECLGTVVPARTLDILETT